MEKFLSLENDLRLNGSCCCFILIEIKFKSLSFAMNCLNSTTLVG